MPSCSGTKPNYAGFVSDYLSYATTAASELGVSIAFILCQWYQEWGLPANNPAWQGSTMGYTTCGSCGSFPMFCSLSDGTGAYIAQMGYYNDNSSWTNVFGNPVSVYNSYNWGFNGGQTAYNVSTDDGYYVTATSQHFYGALESGGNGTTGTYAANEAIGASPWNYGHYMSYTSGDTYPGRRLNVILNNSGWAPTYCYVP
ncbi:hypothetical protein Psch_01254 [Pelotomaculum schinkii]|uniref:Uncharacterized protein n=1 Tax=Pelotomaculum schinkii TaxID=78350 RepID=A0A4Y7RFY5_9FIRM|nr:MULTISPECIES: hypothetical protein [Pelotomaculum]TEB07699.1 hypothetical protein Psch_01254 [Pelotomaculum schinkii]TEB14058.1 hypothetical protein Psfp_03183 [Pelotomaculum sp. FP]